MDEAKILGYAHSEGHTDLCYDDSGRFLITCGVDGDIRIWNELDDEFPQSHHVGEVVYTVNFKKGILYLSSDVNSVVAYTFPKVEPDGIIAQFNSSVYHISCSKNYIAAGGSDFTVKAINLTTKSNLVFRGHDAPVLSVAIDPEEKYLASSSCDGTVRVWRMSDQHIVKIWTVLAKSNDFCNSHSLCRLDWFPTNGEYLALPTDKQIKLYAKETWELHSSLTDGHITEAINACAFSSCGTFLAAATVNGMIIVWDFMNSCIARKLDGKGIKICGLAWNPSRTELAFCDFEGQLSILSNIDNNNSMKNEVCDQDDTMKSDMPYDNAEDIRMKNDLLNDDTEDDQMKNDLPNDDDDDQMKNDLSNDNDEDNPMKNDVLIDDDEDLDMLFDSGSPEKYESQVEVKKIRQKVKSDDEDDDFDIGAIKAKLEPKIFGTEDEEIADHHLQSSDKSEIAAALSVNAKPKPVEILSTPLQTAFQPSSTPVYLEHRFMSWNSVGIVRCYNTEEENSVDVEFHDASIYHPVHLNNTRGHTMAALSAEALLLACPKGGGSVSRLQCFHIGTWDSNKEWIIDMPDDEEIDAITLGTSWAAAATDKRFLHLFTVSGVECEVLCIPGPVVCLAAIDNQLAIAYHQGPGISQEQNLGLLIVDIKNKSCCMTKNCPLPLSSQAFLAWLGYTDEGQPCTVDSSGIIRILNVKHNCKWTPISDTKSHTKGLSDHYFVVGVSEIQQEIRCILCKGSRYPPLLPRPTVTVLPFSIPFCDTITDKGKLEEQHGKLSMLHRRIKSLLHSGFDLDSEMSHCERKWTDVLLKMFALATRTEHEYRAMDIAELMPTSRAVQGAIKYATQRHHMALAERLGQVVHCKLSEECPSDDGSSDEDQDGDKSNGNERCVNLLSNNRGDSILLESEEMILQPKPLSRHRFGLVRERNDQNAEQQDVSITGETSELNAEDSRDGILSSTSSTSSNPFKVHRNKKSDLSLIAHKQKQGSIDEMLNESTRRLSSGQKLLAEKPFLEVKKAAQQSKLLVPSNKTPQVGKSSSIQDRKFGFPLFLEEYRDKICNENPEVDDENVVKIATKVFKELPPGEKQKYKKSSNSEKDNCIESAVSKRKHSCDENELASSATSKKSKSGKEKTKTLSAKTANKLTMFAFTKADV